MGYQLNSIQEKFVVEFEIKDPESEQEKSQRSLFVGNLVQEISKKFPLVRSTYKTILVCKECGGDCTHLLKDVVTQLKQDEIKKAVHDLKTKPKLRRK
jgi:hypothetical protein